MSPVDAFIRNRHSAAHRHPSVRPAEGERLGWARPPSLNVAINSRRREGARRNASSLTNILQRSARELVVLLKKEDEEKEETFGTLAVDLITVSNLLRPDPPRRALGLLRRGLYPKEMAQGSEERELNFEALARPRVLSSTEG